MAQSPIVSGSEVSTPASAVRMNGAAFREAALAPGKLGEAIGQDVGGLFQGISQQIQEGRNAKKIFDADLAMRSTKDQFLQDISKDPKLASDSNTWVPELTQRIKNTEQTILSQKDLGPQVKRHLEQTVGLWGMSTLSEVRTQALRREMSDTKDAGLNVAQRALQDDTDGSGVATAVAAYKALGERGLIGPKEMQQLIDQAPEVSAKSQANTVIATNPIDAPRIIEEQLKDKLPPQQYRIIKHVAMQAQAGAQADNAEALSAQVDDNPLHVIDDKVLQAARDAGKISVPGYQKIQARMKSYAKEATREQGLEETNAFNVAMMEADTPPTDAKTLDTWAAGIKEAGLEWTNPANRRRLNKYVDSKVQSVRKEGERDERPIQNIVFSLMDQDRMHAGAFIPSYEQETTHWFKPNEKQVMQFTGGLNNLRKLTDNQAESLYGKGMTAKKVLEAEQANYAKKRTAMREWFDSQAQAGKKPTIEEANDYRMKLEAPDIINTVLTMSGNQPDITQEAYKKLERGDTYYWKGKQLKKK